MLEILLRSDGNHLVIRVFERRRTFLRERVDEERSAAKVVRYRVEEQLDVGERHNVLREAGVKGRVTPVADRRFNPSGDFFVKRDRVRFARRFQLGERRFVEHEAEIHQLRLNRRRDGRVVFVPSEEEEPATEGDNVLGKGVFFSVLFHFCV